MHLTDSRVLFLGVRQHVGKRNIESQFIKNPRYFKPRIIPDKFGAPGDLDFFDGVFTKVYVENWIEKVYFQRWALQEVHRVLVEGGELILKYSVPTPLTKVQIIINRIAKKIIGKTIFVRANRPICIHDMVDVLEEIEYSILDIRLISGDNINKNSMLVDEIAKPKNIVACEIVSKKKVFDIKDRYVFKNRSKFLGLMERDYKAEMESLEMFVDCYQKDLSTSYDNLPAYKRVLVLSPHPDDEMIGVGGTMMSFIDKGSSVTIVQFTNGSNSEAISQVEPSLRKKIRLDEAKRVSNEIGASLIVLEDIDDGKLIASMDTVTRLQSIIDKVNPDVIFSPFVNDPHPDHLAVNEILYKVLLSGCAKKYFNVLGYEVWAFCPYNKISLITRYMSKKIEILSTYRSALRVVNYVRTTEWFSAYHACHINDLKQDYYEVFHSLSLSGYKKLMGEILRDRKNRE